MTIRELQTLLDYHYWARDRVLDAGAKLTPDQFTKDMGSSFRSVRDTLVHTYAAELIWYSRWVGASATSFASPDQFPDCESLRSAWAELEQKVRRFVAELGEDRVDWVVDYRLLNGQPGSSRFHEMVQHVVNHASYHRGQVTTLIRQLGAQPATGMDMIGFFRERSR